MVEILNHLKSIFKYFTPLRILYPFIKSLVNTFVNITLTSPDRPFIIYGQEVIWVFFSVYILYFIILVILFFISFSSKFVSFTNSSFLLYKFRCFNLSAKSSSVNLLNSLVVINLSWLGIFFSIFSIFVL